MSAALLRRSTRMTYIVLSLAAILNCRGGDNEEPAAAVVVPAARPLDDAGDQPVIDGWFDEWSDDALVLSDGEGDGTAAFDVTRVYATSRGSRLFLRFDTTALLNLYE